MTQFRLYDSPQSFVYDSPQSFLHGVTQEEACYGLVFNDASTGRFNAGAFFETPPTGCASTPDFCGFVPPNLRGANARIAATDPSEDVHIGGVSVPFFNWIPSTPGDVTATNIRYGKIIGVESETQIDAPADMPINVNAPNDLAGCVLWTGQQQTLMTTLDGAQNFWIAWYANFSNNALCDPQELRYSLALYTETFLSQNSAIDYAASNFFTVGEQCYFEGCPAPIPATRDGIYNRGDTIGSIPPNCINLGNVADSCGGTQFNLGTTCDNRCAYSFAPSPARDFPEPVFWSDITLVNRRDTSVRYPMSFHCDPLTQGVKTNINGMYITSVGWVYDPPFPNRDGHMSRVGTILAINLGSGCGEPGWIDGDEFNYWNEATQNWIFP